MPTVLVVEDSPELLVMIADYLERQGLQVRRAATVAEMERHMAAGSPAVILLDVNLPDGDGIEHARRLDLGERCGLIFITSRDTAEDVIAGLDAGGDDYITKPLNLPSLHARIRSVLRRTRETVLTFDGWILDLIRREFFTPNGNLMPLTSGEFNILAALAAARPQPVDRDYLLDVISNRDPRDVSDHTVDTLIARLRRKMRDATSAELPIVTVRGMGYALISKEGRAAAS